MRNEGSAHAGGEATGRVGDSGDGWYNVQYMVEAAGPFQVLLGLSGVYSSGSFRGVCQPAVAVASKCIITEVQSSVVAGQQARIFVSRADRQVHE